MLEAGGRELGQSEGASPVLHILCPSPTFASPPHPALFSNSRVCVCVCVFVSILDSSSSP